MSTKKEDQISVEEKGTDNQNNDRFEKQEEKEQELNGAPVLKEEKEEEEEAWKERYIRLKADFDNYKKRTAKEVLQAIVLSNKRLIQKLLDVVDDFERALEMPSKIEKETHWSGIQLIQHKLMKLLKEEGLEPMSIKKGASFNPEQHEALAQEKTDDPALDGKILQVINKGYLLQQEILRVAKVITGKI